MRAGVIGFQPRRLTQAREARGLTKVALATLVERSSPTLTKWENGDSLPEADSLARLSKALNCPESWFLADIPNYGVSPYFFRSNAATTREARCVAKVRMQWLQDVSIKLQEVIDWPAVNVPHLRAEDFNVIDDATIEEFALQCRQAWGLGLGPVSDMMLALESAGVVCCREEIGYSQMDGLSHWCEVDNRPYVYLVADKANFFRSRFDAAHELGHLVLHRYLKETEFNKRYRDIEAQAHLFASAFLLPADSFSLEITSWPTLDTFLALKKRWKVSVAAMIVRGKQLGIISDEYSTRLWKNYSARGWRRGEPLDIDAKPEFPRLMPRAIEMIVSNNVFGKAALRDHLALASADLVSLCGLGEEFFKAEPEKQVVPISLKSNNSRANLGKAGSAQVIFFPNKKTGSPY